METKGAILCGGVGRRLKPLTDYFQKTMVPIGPRRRPLLEYVIRLLRYHGLKDITLLTGYRSEEIENYFGDGARFGAKLSYSLDKEGGSGSATALARAFSTGKIAEFGNLVVYYGDVLSDLNLAELVRLHASKKASVTLVLSKNYALPVGVAEVTDDKVLRMKEKPTLDISVTMGCMVISKDAMNVLPELASTGAHKDLMAHFIPEVLARKLKVVPYYVKGFWYDVGTTEAYERIDNGTIQRHLKYLG